MVMPIEVFTAMRRHVYRGKKEKWECNVEQSTKEDHEEHKKLESKLPNTASQKMLTEVPVLQGVRLFGELS